MTYLIRCQDNQVKFLNDNVVLILHAYSNILYKICMAINEYVYPLYRQLIKRNSPSLMEKIIMCSTVFM